MMPTDINTQVVDKSSGPWWEQAALKIITLPSGVAIIFSLVFLGMIIGVVPSPITALQGDLALVKQQHMTMMQQLNDLSTANNNNLVLQTKLLRGICIITAKTQADQLNFCNP